MPIHADPDLDSIYMGLQGKKTSPYFVSVADPNPDLSDPYVFGPPVSVSISQRCCAANFLSFAQLS